ncbi:hypothetical protein [Blastopirellula marina]|uniref:Uncharacterized protein n=1 Tax=Blastopirellula marina TaxID=124 RepID=A0A2S8F3D9_9BACT|nr:hypothetical protein [Blastopirellula marina]PQO26444.1 hypothetical protein C5Y98_30365 [Blastopirellula marina]PQO46921.1 hypothetical protein C5Y93_07145 [Blastopirellula marina]PTL40757.1 hypothetical protein C5Y97_30380 [Blastopirellula marina]
MNDFEDRLKKAIQRGEKRSAAKSEAIRAQALSEEELRELHSKLRLQLSDYIEKCVGALPNHFPGFQLETIYGEKGWGAACYRDDLDLTGGRRRSLYSRLEMTIRPYSSVHVLELTAKGAIRNKETFNRSYFEKLEEVDVDTFTNYIDVWIIEYAEIYSGAGR